LARLGADCVSLGNKQETVFGRRISNLIVDKEVLVMADQQFVIFKLQTEEYGIDIQQVQEIVLMQEITHYPQAGDFIEGIINLRGRVIPVIDLKERFYKIKTAIGDNTRIIVLDTGFQVIGIIVDEVMEVLQLKEEMIDPPPFIVTASGSGDGVKGIGKLDNRLLIILDLARLFSASEKSWLNTVAAS
jgi:purine-binding chemotaxis protein CheW